MKEPDSVWSDVFEPRPRFKDCPPICLKTNLPSFQSEKLARAWVPEGYEITKIGPCGFCKHFHELSRPAGMAQLPPNFRPFRRSSPFADGGGLYGAAERPLTIDWQKITRAMAQREVERSMPL